MADDFGFDTGLGTDPFGGGSEGLPQIPASGQGYDTPDFKGLNADGGGLSGFLKGLTGGGDKGSSGGILGGLGGFAKGVALPAAQLGIAGLGIKSSLDANKNARQQAGQLAQGQQIQRESAQPLQQFGTQTLQHAQAGQIDPAVQQQLDNLVQAQLIQARQWMAHNNITDSTMMQSIERDIMNKAQGLKAQVLGMDKDQAIRALTFAMGGGNQIAQTASHEQNELDNLIAASNKALAALTGAAG